jgi:hypothetical protein
VSDTPRTDAVLDKGKLEPITSRAFSLANHSRRLERELAEARATIGGFCSALGESNVVSAMVKLQTALRKEAGEVGE